MAAAFDYGLADIENALASVGVVNGDVVFVQSSLGMLGRPEGVSNIDGICELLDQALNNLVGDGGTIAVPTYTYSFCDGRPFDPSETPSTIGPFAEFFRQKSDVVRSSDPIFSVAASGPKASDLIFDLPNDCFGPGSVYDRLCDLKAMIVTVGLGMEYATFRHHAEQLATITPRFLKAFSGVVKNQNGEREETWLYYVPALIENCEAAGRAAAEQARDKGIAGSEVLGRNQVWSTRADRYRTFLMTHLEQDPWFTSKGPAVDVITEERKRANVKRSECLVTAPYIVSADARSALSKLAKQFDLTIQTWRTGDRFGDWVVPENWQFLNATITVDGSQVLNPGTDFIVVGNSASVRETLSGAELKSHMNRMPAHNVDWALNDISGHLLNIANDAEIAITIDATKSIDELHVAGIETGSSQNLVFVCLSADHQADVTRLEIVLEAARDENMSVCIVPAPMAIIPVISSWPQVTSYYYTETLSDWADVETVLVSFGSDVQLNHFQIEKTSQ